MAAVMHQVTLLVKDFNPLNLSMSGKSLVSILIPAFNAQEWIADTIKSAIAQTWPWKEIIIVDDGSTDQTLRIARQFASKQLKVITQQNQGAPAARNKAFSVCQGDYIQWLDADDLLAADKVACQMKVLESCSDRRILVSGAWGRFMYRVSRAEFIPTRLWCDLSPTEFLLRKIGENLFVAQHAWLVSRELSEAVGAWDVRLTIDEDGEYFCRVILASRGIRFVPDAKVFYRVSNPSSVSHMGVSDKKKDAMLLAIQLYVKYLLSLEDSDRARAACIALLRDWLIYFYPERPDIVEQLERLAASLGSKLEAPRLAWKYAWIKPLFGWRSAKRAQLALPQLKTSLVRFLDRTMCRLESSGNGARMLTTPWTRTN
jgi:glycosyltransferase involved in cell wall biosynthesis